MSKIFSNLLGDVICSVKKHKNRELWNIIVYQNEVKFTEQLRKIINYYLIFQ